MARPNRSGCCGGVNNGGGRISLALIASLLFVRQCDHVALGVVPSFGVDVYVGEDPDSDASADASASNTRSGSNSGGGGKAPSYTMLASEAFFGVDPKMTAAENESKRLAVPPGGDPFMCGGDGFDAGDSGADFGGAAVLIPRGTCTFEKKAYVAQSMGASAVLIYGSLESRYGLNETEAKDEGRDPTSDDIVYPENRHDYDCNNGRAVVPRSDLSFDPLPYNPDRNDPVLSSFQGDDGNLCLRNSQDYLAKCPSKACLLTGSTEDGDDGMEACCAWDLHLYLYRDTAFHPPPSNDTDQDEKPPVVTIPAAYLTMQQGHRLLKDYQAASERSLAEGDDHAQQVTVVIYQRWRPQYNYSSVLIWALGVFVCALASYMSAGDYHTVTNRILKKRRERGEVDPAANNGGGGPAGGSGDGSGNRRRDTGPLLSSQPAEESMELTVYHALGFIVLASTCLLVLFYLKIYAVVKFLYGLGCSKAVSNIIFYPIFKRIGRTCCNYRRDVVLWRTNIEDIGDITVLDLLSHLCGYAVGIAWLAVSFVNRHPEDIPFFWITQNVFGASMCIMFLQVIKLNSIRVASLLLIVAFLYDIFFVFVTPLLFKGKSVMITVATSGGPPTADPMWCEKYPDDRDCQGGNPLPMLLAMPRIGDYLGGSSLLGLGDIVLPGLLLSFAARHDAAKSLLGILGGGNGRIRSNLYTCPEQSYVPSCAHRSECCRSYLCCCCYRSGYFVPLVIAYAVGLFMANYAVYAMQMGQPALLYLVPCCLGTMSLIAWRCNEFGELWDGPKVIRAADAILYGEVPSSQSSSQSRGGDVAPDPSGVIPVPNRDDDDLGDDEIQGRFPVPSAADDEESG